MIRQFHFNENLLESLSADRSTTSPPVWVDLLNPEASEIEYVDRIFSVTLPTLAEMQEIETSSRLYEENGTYYMTIIYVADALGDAPESTPLTFILKKDVLITVHYKELRIVENFIAKAQSRGLDCKQNPCILQTMLLESVIDICADVLEKNHAAIERGGRQVFQIENNQHDYKNFLQELAKIDELNSKIRESLVSLSRLHLFMIQAFHAMNAPEAAKIRLQVLTADVQSLLDHSGFMSNKASFLLDATLGLVSIEQNVIIKIFSVSAVIFLPPTLVASIYGMNFKYMPELNWGAGYPIALGLMIASALLPYLYFKRRGWL